MAGTEVLILSPYLSPPPGGVQRLAMNIADASAVDVRVVGVSTQPSADARVRVVRRRAGLLGAVVTLARFAMVSVSEVRAQPSVVQAMTWRAALPAVLVPRRPPIVLFCHGAELLRTSGGPVNRRLRRFVLRRVSCVVANSRFTASLVREVASRDCVVVHPPVTRIPENFARRTPVGLPSVLSVGRLVRNKGHDRLLRAVAAARDRGVAMKVTIAGTGPERDRLQALIDQLGLRDVATLAGEVSDEELDRLYRCADIFALLSVPVGGEVEGFGIVFLEANAYSLPVVAGRSGGSPDAVEEGVNGLLVDDEEGAVAALVALASDPALRHKLGETGRARLRDFSFERFGERMRQVYSSVASEDLAP